MSDHTTDELPPILRLSADLWSVLPAFLHSGDLIRLISIGAPLLTSRISHHGRHLKLTWNSTRYLDFEEVYATLRRFDLVYSVDFQRCFTKKLHWTPVHLHGWPSSLTSLKLQFFDSINTLMGSGGLNLTLPNLEVLQLSQDMRKWSDKVKSVNFRGLPSCLRVLRLSYPDYLFTAVSQLENLPAQLEELHLDFLGKSCSEEDLGRDVHELLEGKVNLPALPPSITSLYLKHNTSWSWHIDWLILPRSLRTLELPSDAPVIYGAATPIIVGGFNARPGATTIEITSHSHSQTPNLTTLICKKSSLELEDLIDLVPPSVTHFDACLVKRGKNGFDAENVALIIAPKLASTLCGLSEEIDRLVFGGMIPFPRLQEIIAISKLYAGIPSSAIIPPSVTKLVSSSLPASLTSPMQSSPSLGGPMTTPQLVHLTKLQISDPFPLASLGNLPDTLEHITFFPEDNKTASDLFCRMCAGYLPKLTNVNIRREISLHAIKEIPPQLQYLHCRLVQDMLMPLDDIVLRSWKSSNLVNLVLFMADWSEQFSPMSPVDVGYISLWNHLPDSLRVLECAGPCKPSRQSSVTLPPNLTSLRLQDTTDAHFNYIPTTDFSAPLAFVLPPHVTILDLPSPLRWNLAELPPSLSHFYCGKIGVVDEYFNTRTPPRPDLSLSWQ